MLTLNGKLRIGPPVEPRRNSPPLPNEFIMIGNLYREYLARSGDTTQVLRREFHRLLDVTINEVIRKRR